MTSKDIDWSLIVPQYAREWGLGEARLHNSELTRTSTAACIMSLLLKITTRLASSIQRDLAAQDRET
jgi:hypothetical protein